MATGGWGPGHGPGQPGGNGPGNQGWGAPYGPPPPNPGPNPGPYPPQAPYPAPPQNPYPYPYGPQPTPRPAARRPRGCLSFGLVGALLRSTHRLATRLFNAEGDGRIVDRTVDRVQVARTILGAAATVALIFVYSVKPDRWEDAAYSSAAQMLLAPILLLIAGPLVIIGFIYYAPPHLRPHMRSRLRAPLKAVGWYVLSIVVIGGVLTLTGLAAKPEDGMTWWEIVLAVAALIVIVWGFPFFFMASLYSARSAFNTAQVHPMLPPVITTALVWVFAIFSVIPDGLPEGQPLVAQLCATLGGPLSVTAVSLWELRRMKTRFGVTLRP